MHEIVVHHDLACPVCSEPLDFIERIWNEDTVESILATEKYIFACNNLDCEVKFIYIYPEEED